MDVSKSTVAVTGASGFIGVYLCRALLAAGARVVGVVRNPEKAAFLAKEGVEFRKADLADRAALQRAFEGCDAVVANAALYDVLNHSWKDNYRANKEGTENVYEAAAAAGVGRMVHISSFGVYRWRFDKVLDDHSPTLDGAKRQGGGYRATKQLSEQLAFQLSEKHGLATTAVRPAAVYGARDSNTMPWFRGLMKLPILPMPTVRVPMVYAGDVANAVVGALRNDASAGKAYMMAGRKDSVYDFVKAWKKAGGNYTAVVPVPFPFGFRVDCSAAERDLGFRNRSFEEGLRATFQEEASA